MSAMSPETLSWMKVGHVFGFVLWLGPLFGLSALVIVIIVRPFASST